MGTVYLNGEFLPQAQAMVPAMDRGFLFGDGVYEVIPVFGGRCFRLDQHLDRLDRSLQATRIAQPLTRARWQAVFEQLIEANGGGDQAIYLQVTRGVAEVREHRFPPDLAPTVFALTRVIPTPPELPPAPIDTVIVDDIRWSRCDIKSTSLLGSVLMTQQALDAGAREAIVVRDGFIQEGASSNVFAVVDGLLWTAPVGRFILAGVTRDLVLELARKHGQPVREQPLPLTEFQRASEVWISSSTREIVPVARVDGHPVGDGSQPVLGQVWQWYRAFRLHPAI